eukprot:jgi/Ulvmu1/2703/UM014_0159.1
MAEFTFCPSPHKGQIPFESSLSAQKGFLGSPGLMDDMSAPSNDKENSAGNVLRTKPLFSPAPTTPTHVKPIRVIQASQRRDDLPAMIDLICWRNPAASFGAMATGTAVCLAGHVIFTNSTPFLSGLSTVLAVMLALNFFRGAFSSSWLAESAWQGSSFEAFLIDRSKDFILFMTVARDHLMCSENPWVMLQTCIALAVVRNVSYYMNFWTIVAVGWVGMFITAPFQKRVGAAISMSYVFCVDKYKSLATKLKMRRISKAVWLSVAIVAVMIFTDLTSRLFLGLAFLMFLRCCMRKEQVIALQQSPLVQTVTNNSLLRSAFRAGETAGALMDDVLMSAMKSARKQMDADEHNE